MGFRSQHCSHQDGNPEPHAGEQKYFWDPCLLHVDWGYVLGYVFVYGNRMPKHPQISEFVNRFLDS